MKCPTCNAELPNDTEFCPNCKAVLKDVENLKKQAAERVNKVKQEEAEALAAIDKNANGMFVASIALAAVVVVAMIVVSVVTGGSF